MTTDPERRATLVEQVAELDAGLVDGREAGAAAVLARRSELAADPGLAAVVDALAATSAELAAAPPVPLPAGTAERWSALVDGLHELPEEEPEPVSRWRLPVALTAVAAALVVVAAGVAALSAPERPTVTDAQLVSEALATLAVPGAGELADPARRAECLAAVAPRVRPDAPLVGGRQVRYAGRPATLLLLGTGRLGQFTAIVVEDGCGALLTQRDVP
jgi:hypothetical protein